jgi:superfamily II DNA or RNA helicase
VKTFGQLDYQPPNQFHRGTWYLRAEPHVMMRLKRVFGRVRQERSGLIAIGDTLDVARDLDWFLTRYPLKTTARATTQMQAQVSAWENREDIAAAALAGVLRDHGLRDPARPARPYQVVASDLAIATGRLLITDEVGLGKSMTGTLVLRAEGALPAVVVTLTHLPKQWEHEIALTLPWLRTHIVRRATPYEPTDLRGVNEPPDVLIMGYSKLAGWGDHLAGWAQTIVFDEMQELRRDGTLKYEAAALIADQARYGVGLTATPVYNYGVEAYNLISVLDQDALGTREEFVREWTSGDNTTNKGKVLVNDPHALGTYLRDRHLMIGRTRAEVGRELPEAIPVVEVVNSDPSVLDAARGDAAEMARLILDRTADSAQRFSAAGQLDMMMRQATGVAKAPYVAEFVRFLLESEQKIVLFGWHREVYDLWLQALADFQPVLYTGTESPTRKRANAEQFMTGGSRVLIMSLRSGAGLDGLQNAAQVAVFGELDWSPQVHEQCIGRLRRDGASDSNPVVAFYLVADEGSDPVVAELLQLKRNQAEPMLSKDGRLFSRPAAQPDRSRLLAEAVLASCAEQGLTPVTEATTTAAQVEEIDPGDPRLPVLALQGGSSTGEQW